MMGSLAPWGMPLSPAVWSGERADDGGDLPLIERLRSGLRTPGRLCVGDGPMRALAPRA
jgi:transposase